MQSIKTTIKLKISGMTCINCQNKIEKQLKNTDGIIYASVSYHNSIANIVYDKNRIKFNDIIAVIERLGYQILLNKEEKIDLIRTICILVIIISIYIILQSLGLFNLLVPSQLADSTMSYGMFFVIGLLTSLHCVAMCGGIHLSQSLLQIKYQSTKSNKSFASFFSSLAYNLGRVFSYTIIGFVFGLLGFMIGGNFEIILSVLFQGILKIIAGILMVIMGLNMLHIFPWFYKLTLPLPAFMTHKIKKQKTVKNQPFYIGMLNGFMPCGPLQSMWIVALASTHPFSGALSMFMFAIGTVPAMLGLSSIVVFLGKKLTHQVMTVGSILVVILGLSMLSQGGSLSGLFSGDLLLVLMIVLSFMGVIYSIPVNKKTWKIVLNGLSLFLAFGSVCLWNGWETSLRNDGKDASNVKIVDGIQIVNSTLTPGQYPNITVKEGVPVKWIIDAPEGSINGCNYQIYIQDFDMKYTFQSGENIIEFTPHQSGHIEYSCWMGMIHGNIYVIKEK